MGIIYQNDAYGQDGLKGFTAGVSAYNLNKVASATYNATDTAYTSQVLAMKNARRHGRDGHRHPHPSGHHRGHGRGHGLSPQWIFQGPAWSEFLMSSTGSAGGTATPVAPALKGVWVLGYEAQWGDTTVAGMSQFLAAQQQFYPTQVPDAYYMYGYCLAMMEKDVLAKAIANKDLSRQGVLDAKLNLGAVDFGGLIPNANYTPNLGPADRQTGIYKVDTATPGYLKQIEPYFTSTAGQSMTFAGG